MLCTVFHLGSQNRARNGEEEVTGNQAEVRKYRFVLSRRTMRATFQPVGFQFLQFRRKRNAYALLPYIKNTLLNCLR